MTEWLLLNPDPASPRSARHFVMAWLRKWDYGCLVEPAALVMSELATNSVRHAGRPFRVGVEDLGHGVRVSVQDPVSAPPVPRAPSESDQNGRGMRIVDALSDRWGTDQVPDGKVVWCTLAAADRSVGYARH